MTFYKYIVAAFNARPFGIFIPPNWIAIGAVGMLGFIDPGFLIIGAGLELAYLFGMSFNSRFQAAVDGEEMAASRQASQDKISLVIGSLSAIYAQRYTALKFRCADVMKQGGDSQSDVAQIAQGLDRLLWIYLKLLKTSSQLEAVQDTKKKNELSLRRDQVKKQLNALPEDQVDQRSSLEQTLETLDSRVKVQQEAIDKLGFCKSELQRIEEEVELVREQSLVATEPVAVTRQVSAITSGLASTNSWIVKQQELFGSLTDELSEPGPILATQR